MLREYTAALQPLSPILADAATKPASLDQSAVVAAIIAVVTVIVWLVRLEGTNRAAATRESDNNTKIATQQQSIETLKAEVGAYKLLLVRVENDHARERDALTERIENNRKTAADQVAKLEQELKGRIDELSSTVTIIKDKQSSAGETLAGISSDVKHIKDSHTVVFGKLDDMSKLIYELLQPAKGRK